MDELESQIAKIALGNNKSSSSYIFVLAEKAPTGDDELYIVAELPLFNPAAAEACERICLAIASTLKRVYKRPGNENAFENAISQINEELGKLASMGQTQWIDKLNCILGVKQGNSFSISTCGKVSAYLLRNGEYTDLNCSQTQSHPLKTFENYASGKIRLGDLLLLSTIQLFNYISMDRLLHIIRSGNFLTSTQTVIQLLKETADPQVSFGVILNLQVPVGETAEEEVDLENYVVEKPGLHNNILGKGLAYVKTAFALDKHGARVPKVALPKVSLQNRFQGWGGWLKNLLQKSKGWWKVTKVSAQNVKNKTNFQNFKLLSRQKKIFLVSALVLLLALGANIGIAIKLKKNRQAKAGITAQLKEAQTLIASAQASLLYQDDIKAAEFLDQARNKIPDESSIDTSNKDLYTKVLTDLSNTGTQMEKIMSPEVSNLGSLGGGENLIKLPNYLATQVNQVIVSYNKQNGKVEDNTLKAPVDVKASVYRSGDTAAIYDGKSLYMWDFATGKLSPGFSQNVPETADFAGLAYYGTNSRVYVVDKKTQSITSFAAGSSGFARPTVSVNDQLVSQAIDITIDSNIYILGKDGVNKFQNGKLADFTTPHLVTPLSGSGKIYTEKDFVNLYVLDSGNSRILIMDKNGNLMQTLQSDQFTKLRDFQVDEKNKTMYVLNDSSLLKVKLP